MGLRESEGGLSYLALSAIGVDWSRGCVRTRPRVEIPLQQVNLAYDFVHCKQRHGSRSLLQLACSPRTSSPPGQRAELVLYGTSPSKSAPLTIWQNSATALTVMASLAIPTAAAAASLTYLNARWSLPTDWLLISSLVRARIWSNRRLRRDRVNNFYILEEHAHNSSIKDQPFIVYGSQAWTFKQTYDLVLRYAGWLHETHKVSPGEVIAIDSTNKPSFLFLCLALWSLGALPALINFNLTGEALIHSIRASTARIVIVDPEVQQQFTSQVNVALLSPTFRQGSLPLSFVTLTTHFESSLPYFSPYRAPDAVRSIPQFRSPAALIFTSGTTGLPKPAIVPWERMCMGGRFCLRLLGLNRVNTKHPDRFYTSMPLYHSSAFVLGFNACLTNGVTFVLGHKFSTRHFWSEVRSSKATIIQYVGETLRYLMTTPPMATLDQDHSVRMAFGNGLRPDVWEPFKRRFNVPIVAEFYGATEASSASFNISRNSMSSGAIGKVGALGSIILKFQNAIVKVDWDTEEPYRDPKTGFCVPLPSGQTGELLLRLDAKDIADKYVGYFKNEKASAKKIMRDVLKKGDAWYRTGDVVMLDNDGMLWFSDRIGDTFRWKSENVSTVEVAQVLGMHPMIQEANVYGVGIPGYEGRAGCAALLLAEAAFTVGGKVNQQVLESLATFATNSLPRYAVPVFLRVVKEVQVTGNNKQQKVGLRRQGADPSAATKDGDQLFWLRPGADRYVPFENEEWQDVKAGRARL